MTVREGGPPGGLLRWLLFDDINHPRYAKFIGDFYSKKVHLACFSAIFRTKTRYSHALTALHTQHIRAANTEHGDTFSGNSA